jgi:hypothetical protein
MKHKLASLSAAGLAVLLCACATTKVEKTWKSPNAPQGPVQKVAVLVVSDLPPVRPALESRLARDIGEHDQAVMTTVKVLSLTQVKEDKAAAAALLRQQGADSILIVRLADKATYEQQVRVTPAAFVPVATGFSAYDWGSYYDIAFVSMGVTHSSLRDYLVLDSSLFDLRTGQRLWSARTQTVLKEDADRLVVADGLAGKLAAALRKDGLIR